MRVADLRQLVAVSVIGYILDCDMCNARMLVTADYKNGQFCPDCLDVFIQDSIADAIADEDE